MELAGYWLEDGLSGGGLPVGSKVRVVAEPGRVVVVPREVELGGEEGW